MEQIRDRLYIATFSKEAVSVIGDYRLGIELNDLCISENLDAEKVEQTIGLIEQEISEAKADRILIHGPFTEIVPASIDHRAVQLGLDRLDEAYDVCTRLGVNKLIAHSGYIPLLYFHQWHIEKSVPFWRGFLADKPEDFTLYIENVFEEEPTIMKELIQAIGDTRVKLCLDIGHANAMTAAKWQVTDWIRELGPYIGHFHLHNNTGERDDHDPIMEGTMDIAEIFTAIETFCPANVTMTIESRSCRSSVLWLKEKGYI